MAGTLKKDAPIVYTEDAVIVSPLDWNNLVDIILKLKSDNNANKAKIQSLENNVTNLQTRVNDLESP